MKLRLASFALLLLLAVAACGGEEPLSETDDALVFRTASFTIPRGDDPIDDFAAPGGSGVADYKLCCFGSSCSVASGICAFSTWTCTTKTETREGTVYSGCSCTKHCG